jgi:hypothetical protein
MLIKALIKPRHIYMLYNAFEWLFRFGGKYQVTREKSDLFSGWNICKIQGKYSTLTITSPQLQAGRRLHREPGNDGVSSLYSVTKVVQGNHAHMMSSLAWDRNLPTYVRHLHLSNLVALIQSNLVNVFLVRQPNIKVILSTFLFNKVAIRKVCASRKKSRVSVSSCGNAYRL